MAMHSLCLPIRLLPVKARQNPKEEAKKRGRVGEGVRGRGPESSVDIHLHNIFFYGCFVR